MSATAAADAPPAKGKKKLILMVAAAVLVLAVAGGAAMVLMKKKPVDADDEGGDGGQAAAATAVSKRDPSVVPVFVPLDPFTVNLADRNADHYAQIGITLEIDDAKTGEQIKLYMPAIRNNILMAIADRSSTELMDREGKRMLADRVKRETSRALGIDVAEPDAADVPGDAADADADTDDDKPKKKKKKKARKSEPVLPVKAVHFSNFIIQ